MVLAGDALHPGLPDSDRVSGRHIQYSAGDEYQSLYRRVPQRGFSVTISQRTEEILASSNLTYDRQFWLNVNMTLLILTGLFWTWRVLGKRQEAFRALEMPSRSTSN